jgi:transposase
VLTLPPSVKVFLAAGATDMRKSFDGLSGLARSVPGEDPLSGHLFVFCNRRRDRLKILYFDGSGLWVFAKRLEKGTFSWPEEGGAPRVEMRAGELALLVGGIDLSRTRRRRWYERKPA